MIHPFLQTGIVLIFLLGGVYKAVGGLCFLCCIFYVSYRYCGHGSLYEELLFYCLGDLFAGKALAEAFVRATYKAVVAAGAEADVFEGVCSLYFIVFCLHKAYEIFIAGGHADTLFYIVSHLFTERGVIAFGYPLREQLCLTGSVLPAGWEGRIRKDATKAPACFTESTLLGAMEKAGADETCKEAERTGLGTPATRADIIEKLIHDGYVMRTGKKLSVTDEGRKLVALLPSRIKSASYTAEWANRLAEIAAGKREAGDFMKSIENEVRQMVSGNEGER